MSHRYQGPNKDGESADGQSGDSQMRTFSFMLAFVFALAAPSMAGSPGHTLPGIGTFAYNGSPIVTSGLDSIIVAAR